MENTLYAFNGLIHYLPIKNIENTTQVQAALISRTIVRYGMRRRLRNDNSN